MTTTRWFARILASVLLGLIAAVILASLLSLAFSGCGGIARSIGEYVGNKAVEQIGDNSDRIGALEGTVADVKEVIADLLKRMDAAKAAGAFPWNVFLGFIAVGGAVSGVLLFFGPTRAFAGVAFAGGVLLGTAVVVKLMFWQILLGVLGIVILAGLGLLLYALFTRGALKKVVSSFEKKAIAEKRFNEGIKDAMTDADGKPVLSKSEAKLVDKLRRK